MVGADIANICNEGAIFAARRDGNTQLHSKRLKKVQQNYTRNEWRKFNKTTLETSEEDVSQTTLKTSEESLKITIGVAVENFDFESAIERVSGGLPKSKVSLSVVFDLTRFECSFWPHSFRV